MTETLDKKGAEVPTTSPGWDDGPVLPKAHPNGFRTMVPGSWVGRSLKLEYASATGKEMTLSGTLQDWCPLGVILNVGGTRTIIAWERVVLVELND